MLYTHNENELVALGNKLGNLLEPGQVIVLTGDLGAGKTTFTKGIAKGLDIEQMIKSPTYTIVREYEGRLPLYHLDVYRIGDDPDSIDLDDFLYGDGVCVIEWGELLSELPADYLEVKLSHINEGRQLDMIAYGTQSQLLLEAFGNG
ncbi:tRNA (adenosine(37)-N6)-threonylcarbamoyltransferase complex ATPase subunit type 1 TsaE [Streptococcus hillyeri]|uniref:tRNA threonylcarbamoyladenosine biosynthesis protein TsaE n=1 Tax=Streptococcus hillyeri TaxID=2282420 RepID=A0A3L9DU52_9STRE|nr:tRNA (adenosine(37)-N6)-threonylcarbamoyltransferase complex ATPase subunit type 1 TsaE [Streptococcus hillyeri]RLY03219.1 tRNA (adenosine(37)-N6)-threonylcarbamoyltransferase complex ATPase subunit type 1 TsaE [Streptococcus hillyeri]